MAIFGLRAADLRVGGGSPRRSTEASHKGGQPGDSLLMLGFLTITVST